MPRGRSPCRTKLEHMFDPEVLVQLRETFDRADADGSGEIDAKEAASLFASYCEPGASAAEIQRTAGNLMNTLDTDRSGRLSFEEFAFRFGRKLQMEVARDRRKRPHEGAFLSHSPLSRHGVPPPERTPAADLVHLVSDAAPSSRTSTAVPAGGVPTAPAGAYMRRPPTASSAAGSGGGGGANSSLPTAGGWSRETLTVVGIIFALLAILILAIVTPAPDAKRASHSRGSTRGR